MTRRMPPSVPKRYGHTHPARWGGCLVEDYHHVGWEGWHRWQSSQPLNVEGLAPSLWKLGSLPVTTHPIASSWSSDIRIITRDSALSQLSPWVLCGNMMLRKR